MSAGAGRERPGSKKQRFLIKILSKSIDFECRGWPGADKDQKKQRFLVMYSFIILIISSIVNLDPSFIMLIISSIVNMDPSFIILIIFGAQFYYTNYYSLLRWYPWDIRWPESVLGVFFHT